MNKIYTENENFFKKLDTPEKAYILGFFYADGCNHDKSKIDDGYNHQNCISFTQLEQDLDILEQIRHALTCNRPFKEVIQKTNSKKKYSLDIISDQMSADLSRLGAIPAKSLVLTFPKFIPDSLMPHFIRGYFDGDGCIWNGKRKKMTVKDERHPGITREKIVHNVKFTFTGNVLFITEL